MKKVINLVVILCMILSCTATLADSDASAGFEAALIAVKQKISVPAHLTEFTPFSHEDTRTGITSYTFMWQDEEGRSTLEVSADELGRINRYYAYDSNLKSDKKLTSLSKADIISFAEDFARKTFPEAFGTNDTLVFDSDSWMVNSLNYTLGFDRVYDGIKVKDNNVTIRIQVVDDVAYIRNVTMMYDYDATFETANEDAPDIEQKYKEAYPAEIIYLDEYSQDKQDTKTALVYRYKDNRAGYILASTGESVTEDVNTNFRGAGSSSNKEMAADSTFGAMLTDKEIAELDKIEGLISADKAYSILKKLPYLKFDSSLKRSYLNIRERDKKYLLTISYSDSKGERNITATLDGVSGEVISINNYMPYTYKAELTESQKKSADKCIDKFLSTVAGDKLDKLAKSSETHSGMSVGRSYERVVNGIRYISDGLYVNFNAEHNVVTGYNLDFAENRTFADPEGVLDADAAYEALLDSAPLKKLYVSVDGTRKVCYTVGEYGVQVDAFTGKKYEPYASNSQSDYSYNDLDGHWAQERINKLAEVQIGLGGESFRPDEAITQYDLLRLFGAGVRYKSYLDYNQEDLYRILADEGLISAEENTPEAPVTREDACVFMIRFADLESVAKLEDIFKVSYADSDLISQGKTGYPAILTGMGVICGNGGKLRPNENITRAEAMVMLYNYMVR